MPMILNVFSWHFKAKFSINKLDTGTVFLMSSITNYSFLNVFFIRLKHCSGFEISRSGSSKKFRILANPDPQH
jgi:hypothetical protein